jgi:arsenate reductase-like glutaredoxin family protein
MVSIATSEREIVLLYNSNIKNHREVYAYAKSANTDLNAIDLQEQNTTGTLWGEIADLMNKEVKDLIHTDHSSFVQNHGENVSIDNDSAIKLLQEDPETLVFPIAVKGKKAIEAKIYADITDLIDPDTAAVDIP